MNIVKPKHPRSDLLKNVSQSSSIGLMLQLMQGLVISL